MKPIFSMICIVVIVSVMLSGCQAHPTSTTAQTETVTTITTSAASATTTGISATSTTVPSSTTTITSTTAVPTTVATAHQVTASPTTVYVPPTTTPTTPPTMARPTVPAGASPSGVCLAAEFVNQVGFPTGCESASATMMLRYWGVNMTVARFVDQYLDKGEIRYTSNGVYAPHPSEKFVGDPRSKAAYGCYAPVIVRAINKCLPSNLKVVNETGSTLSSLCSRYIDNGMPVMVWATQFMEPAKKGDTWIVESTGKTFQWLTVEHCLLMIGYDQNNYYFMDTNTNGFAAYSRATSEARFAQMGYQAVAVRPVVTTTTTKKTTTTTTTVTATEPIVTTTVPEIEVTTTIPEDTATTTLPTDETDPTLPEDMQE